MKFDHIYQYVGELGRFQVLVVAALYLQAFLGADIFLQLFINGNEQVHWCKVPGVEEFPSDWQKWFIHPFNEDETAYDVCKVFDLDFESFSQLDFLTWDRDERTPNGTPTRDCYEWNYDNTTFDTTIRQEFKFTCEDHDMAVWPTSSWFLGIYLGAYILGEVSDRNGRKPVYFISLLMKIIAGMPTPWSPTFWSYNVFMFIGGFFSGGTYVTGYVLLGEMVSPKHHSVILNLYHMSFTLGMCFYSAVAYGIRDWRTLTGIPYPLLVICLFTIFIIPESPRWLVREKKKDKAMAVLTRIAKNNKIDVPENLEEMVDEIMADEKKVKRGRTWRHWMWHGYRSQRLRWATFSVHYFWYIMSYVYYQMAIGSYLDWFMNFHLHAGVVHGLMEIPAIIVAILCVEWKVLGRNYTAGWAMLGSTFVSLTIVHLVVYENWYAWIAMSFIGKALYMICFVTIWQMTFEFFPTESRNAGMGFGSMMARSGGTYAVLIATPLHEPNWALPYVLFGAFAVFGGIFMLYYVPETGGHHIPQVWEEVKGWKDKCLGESGSKRDKSSSDRKISERPQSYIPCVDINNYQSFNAEAPDSNVYEVPATGGKLQAENMYDNAHMSGTKF